MYNRFAIEMESLHTKSWMEEAIEKLSSSVKNAEEYNWNVEIAWKVFNKLKRLGLLPEPL